MFENAEICSSINPDEVIAIGACVQASLITNENPEFNQSLPLKSLNYDLVFVEKNGQDEFDQNEVSVLIPRLCPIPVRKSHHLVLTNKQISVKVFLRSQKDELTDVCEVSIILTAHH